MTPWQSRNSFIPAKQPFSRSVLSQRKVTINDFFTLHGCLLVSPLLPSVTTLGWKMRVPGADNQEIYNVTEQLEFTVTRVNFDGSFKPLHSDVYYSASQDLSDFQWRSFENIKRQSKLTLSSQIIISSLGLSSNFLTLKFSLSALFRDLRTTHHHFITWRHRHLLT